MKLHKHLVEKPWGRNDVPRAFGDVVGRNIGEVWYETTANDALPILVKWLFTSEKLSIQVHPNDVQAQERGLASGKEECWFVVSAEPGAVLGIGTQSALSADALRGAALSGEVEMLMDWKPVSAGDYYYIPAGTVHAIGAGITLVEVQQYADVTYRLFDYGRPRDLHLDDGVAVSVAAPYADLRSGRSVGGQQLVNGPFFQLWYIDDIMQLALLPDTGPILVIPLAGDVSSGAEYAYVGDCLLIDAIRHLALSNNARLLAVSWPVCCGKNGLETVRASKE
jgi:mannose-6-phosphate isomerase